MSTFRRVLGCAWIPAITWLGSIGVAEGVFRGLGKWPSNNVGGVYESFGEGSFKHRPNCAVRENWFSGEFFIYTDDLGLRFGARPEGGVKPGRRIDFLVLGDSQGFGNGVNFEDSIVGVLQTQAQAAGFTLANASVGGHFLRNQIELAKWLRHERDLEVRSILLLLTPRMVSDADGYATASIGEDGRLYGSRPSLVARIRAWLRTHSSIYVVVRDAYRSTGAGAGDESSRINFYRVDDERRKELKKAMMELTQWSAGIGVPVVVAFLPLVIEIRGDATAPTWMQGLSFDAPYRLVHDVTTDLDLPLIDVRLTLERLREQGNPLQLRGDPHYDAATSHAVGRQIWAELAARSLIVPIENVVAD